MIPLNPLADLIEDHPRVSVAVLIAVLAGMVWFFAWAASDSIVRFEQSKPYWPTVIVRICSSGTVIWRAQNGELVTVSGSRFESDDPAKVCD